MPRRGVWVHGTAELDVWMEDGHRDPTRIGPDLGLAGGWVLWPDRDAGLELRGDLRYQLALSQFTALLSVRLTLARDRALDELRPTRTSVCHARAWGQDRAAERHAPRQSVP